MDIEMTKDQIDAVQGRAYETGLLSAAEDLPIKLRTLAGDAFANKQRERANILMELSDSFEEQAKVLRTQFNTKHHTKQAF